MPRLAATPSSSRDPASLVRLSATLDPLRVPLARTHVPTCAARVARSRRLVVAAPAVVTRTRACLVLALGWLPSHSFFSKFLQNGCALDRRGEGPPTSMSLITWVVPLTAQQTELSWHSERDEENPFCQPQSSRTPGPLGDRRTRQGFTAFRIIRLCSPTQPIRMGDKVRWINHAIGLSLSYRMMSRDDRRDHEGRTQVVLA